MKTFLRTLGIILAAAGICIIILALLTTATNMLTVIETEPADFLPADHTVALFTNVSEETLRQFETIFPVLGEVPSEPYTTVALLRFEENILIAQFEDVFTQEEEHTFGRFNVTASDELVFDLLKTSTPRLRSLSAYQALSTGRKRNGAWIFLDRISIPEPQLLPQKLAWLALPHESTHIAMTADDNRVQLSFAQIKEAPKRGLPPTITSTFSSAFLTARFANADQSLNHALDTSDASVRSLLEGTLRRIVEEYFSTEVSFLYDFKPLLQGPTSIHLGSNTSGTVVALEGVTENSKDLSLKLQKLHEDFTMTTKHTRITERTFDSRFSSKDIRIDEKLSSSDTYEHSNWTVYITRAPNGTTLATAQRGATFAISNDEASLIELLKQDASIAPPKSTTTTSATRLADGFAKTEKLKVLLEEHFPMVLEGNFLPLPMSLSGTVLWSLQQRGAVRIITAESR